ncbi:MAG TPA: hypothetical protein VIP70_02230 [Nitrososphaeraceae archaeon]
MYSVMNKTESSRELETGSYLEAFLYRAPKKNHDAITQNLKKFIPWFENNGARIDYYQLGGSDTQGVIDSAKESGMEAMESIARTLSVEGDEDIWMELQYFRDHNHCKEVYAKMVQDKSLEPLGKEFFSLVTQGKNLITGGFSRL